MCLACSYAKASADTITPATTAIAKLIIAVTPDTGPKQVEGFACQNPAGRMPFPARAAGEYDSNTGVIAKKAMLIFITVVLTFKFYQCLICLYKLAKLARLSTSSGNFSLLAISLEENIPLI